ncbi:MAG: hypothetical protein M3Q17_09955 [Actinomycetota bacterium]|nr:hypothetical protein [Actinomycetota bacterium]
MEGNPDASDVAAARIRAARPGRVDQAVELTLPDASARRRLFDLYRRGLEVDVTGLDEVMTRTEGVTASFLKELLRRAAVVAAKRSGDGRGDVETPKACVSRHPTSSPRSTSCWPPAMR